METFGQIQGKVYPHLALYLTHLSESVESKVEVEEAVHALVWMHHVAGLRPVGGVPTGAGDSPGCWLSQRCVKSRLQPRC